MRVEGVVWDSLRTFGPLAGATVRIVGHDLVTRSDSRGQFTFERVPAGRWTISFSHPRLDSLALFEVPASVLVPVPRNAKVRLATPGPERLYGALCRALTVSPAGVVVGRVISADDGSAIVGATVRARWREVTIEDANPRAQRRGGSRETPSLVEREGVREAVSGDDGTFRLCDVPVDGSLDLQARTYDRASGVVRFDPLERVVSVRDVAISLEDSAATFAVSRAGLATAVGVTSRDSVARADSLVADTTLLPVALGAGSATLAGVVRRDGGAPVAGAMVRVAGALGGARTDAAGTWRLARVPAGTHTVDVVAIGVSPESRIVTLGAGARDTLDFVMTGIRTLERTTVYGNPSVKASFLDGVMRRSTTGFGRLVKGDEIREEFSIGDALQRRGMLRIQYGPNGRVPVIRFGMRDCVPAIAIDGARVIGGPENFDLLVAPEELFAVEVFRRGSEVPSELQAALDLNRQELSSCGLIAIWRR